MKENTLGERLKKLRIQKGVTQKTFADALNVSSSAVSKWENGQNVPDMEMLLEIARYYGKSLEELLEGELKKADDINDNPDSKDKDSGNQTEFLKKGDSRKKWLGVGIALGCVMTLFLVTAVILLGKIWFGQNSHFSYEIVAGRYVEEKEWGEIYEISVFYTGELTDERIEEIAEEIMEQWEKNDLCSMDIETLKILYNDDRELAESFGEISKTVIYYLFPYNMPH